MLTEKDVYAFFGRTYASRGSSYQRHGAVRGATLDRTKQIIFGQVKGSQSQPYEVEVAIDSSTDEIFQARCSCPMGGLCKHSAALMLHLIRTTDLSLAPDVQEFERENTSKTFDSWLEDLQSAGAELVQADTNLSAHENKYSESEHKIKVKVVYLFDASKENRLTVEIRMFELLENDALGNSGQVSLEKLAFKAHSYLLNNAWANADAKIAQLLMSGYTPDHKGKLAVATISELSILIIKMILATGRCYWQTVKTKPLTMAENKTGHLQWNPLKDGRQQLNIETDNADEIVALAGDLWYVNSFENRMGAVDLPLQEPIIARILDCPPMSAVEVELAVNALKRLANLPSESEVIPNTISEYTIETRIVKPLPYLKLTMSTNATAAVNFSSLQERDLQAFFGVDYGDPELNKVNTSEVKVIEGRKITVLQKDRSMEDFYLTQLEEFGLFSTGRTQDGWRAQLRFRGKTIGDWFDFVGSGLPALRSAGWQIEIDKNTCTEAVVPQDWFIETKSKSEFWFNLELGITIDGKRVALLPILKEAFMMLPDMTLAKFIEPPPKVTTSGSKIEINSLEKPSMVYAPLEEGKFVALPSERVRAIVGSMLEFFNKRGQISIGPELSLPQLLDLSKTLFTEGTADFWVVGDELKQLTEKIKAFEAMKIVEAPAALQATLRPYQTEGLCWFNFIREFKLGGILADDMGLGKTVQTLAHILLEKQENRLNKPYLIVCPTSVFPNWLSEIAKFAPSLVATPLYGAERQKYFCRIPSSDIVLTTYPLIHRDLKTLSKQHWNAVILDEAQFIKNANTKLARAVTTLQSEYRISLTGTPVENHLGEIWSQFNFLMPGYLGDKDSFKKNYRTPIEKHNDLAVQKKLAERIRPFLLRRKKETVAQDLPEKTIIIKKFDINGPQRDLYETMRVAMYYKIKEALMTKGLARSHILIIEAMLKLRQACCDPRLLPIELAKNVEESAKLELLLSMLEKLVAEGRKILLFSQFTSMLDLIIPELEIRKIDFVQIRGSTKDRATPVKQFQEGDIPLFLLSLKAGGTGLNLTAADTVIHYDPWWNPAVENQATDRAHRIGQNKPVFVFKLIASDTIEERIVTLQDLKKDLADNLYSEDNSLPTKISQADIEQLFSPPTP